MIDENVIVYTKELRQDGGAVFRAAAVIGAQIQVNADALRYVGDPEIRARLRRELYAGVYGHEHQLVGALAGVVQDLIAAALDGARSYAALERAQGYQRLANECLDALRAAMRPPVAVAGSGFVVVQAPRKPPGAWDRSMRHPARGRQAED